MGLLVHPSPRGILVEREQRIEAIMEFIDENRESYASLAVCRRALERGLAAVDDQTIQRLEQKLQTIPEDELEAYYYIIR
jgi:hypothetical protein